MIKYSILFIDRTFAVLADPTRPQVPLRLKDEPGLGRLKVEVRHLASCKVSSKWELYTRT